MATHYELLLRARDAHALARMLQDDAVEPAAAEGLIDLLAEASVTEDGGLPPDRAAVGSHVTYVELPGGAARSVTLVMPSDARVSEGRISVLSPVGLALLGRAPGAEIEVAVPGGLRFPVRLLASAPEPLREAA